MLRNDSISLKNCSSIKIDLSLVGFGSLAGSRMFAANLADILKTFENVSRVGLHETMGDAIFIFLEAIFDIPLHKQVIGVVFDFDGYSIVLHVDLTGRYDLE